MNHNVAVAKLAVPARRHLTAGFPFCFSLWAAQTMYLRQGRPSRIPFVGMLVFGIALVWVSRAFNRQLSLDLILVSGTFAVTVQAGYWIIDAWCGRLTRKAAYLYSEQLRIVLLWPINSLFIGLLYLLPHTRHGRIRVITFMNDDKKWFVRHSSSALDLIERYAASQYMKLSCEVRFIIDLPP